MKPIIVAVVGLFVTALGVEAQNAAEIERALHAAPSRARDGAAVIRWEGDTWTTLREGRGTLVCYDHSGAPGEAAFSSQCTHPDNLERVAQNFRFEAQANGDRQALQTLLAEAEANGTRAMPVFGSPWIAMNGPDMASARRHVTIAMPYADERNSGFPETGSLGGAWIMGAGTPGAHLMVPGS